ncbi:MAG: ABC transporter ATP-binding protein, partial [Muribaculaceae bacterium]|nr:ABC transporter ATP-binding protein [Muribaculaceae bacterium]
TKDILKQAIKDFNGTVIVVSHDREFLDGLVEKVYEFGGGQVRECLGGIYDFLEKKKLSSLAELELSKSPTGKKAQEPTKATTLAPTKSVESEDKAKPRFTYAEMKEQERTLRKTEKKVTEAEAKIGRLEGEVAAVEAKMAEGCTDTEIFTTHAALRKQLDNAMSVWELASMELDELRARYGK